MRFLLTKTVQKFRGIAQYPPINTLTMDWARDLLNVIVNKMGWVSKFRLPLQLTPPISTSAVIGGWFFTQAASSLRQFAMAALAQTSGILTPFISYIDTTAFPSFSAPTLIDQSGLFGPEWDAVESNNLLYMANGQVMKKWAGAPIQPIQRAPVSLSSWGIARPALAPVIGWKFNIAAVKRVNNLVTITLSIPARRHIHSPDGSGDVLYALTFKGTHNPPLPADVGWDALTLVSHTYPDLNADYYIVGDGPNPPDQIECYQSLSGPDRVNAPDSGYIIISSSSFNGAGFPNGEAIFGLARKNGVAKLYLKGGISLTSPDTYVAPGEAFSISGGTFNTTFNGTWECLSFDGDSNGWYISFLCPGSDVSPSLGGSTYGNFFGGLTFGAAAGSFWLWAYSYKCSVTGEEGPISPILSAPPTFCSKISNQRVYLFAPSDPSNPIVDTVCWYRSQIGSGTLYLHSEHLLAPQSYLDPALWSGQFLNDGRDDTALNTAATAPINNFPAPVGSNLSLSQGRIFISGLVDDPNAVAYSAYETVLRGRPETCFYPYNRLRLATGAGAVAGHGVLQAGIVIWSKSDRMFMLKGSVSDITLSSPVNVTDLMDELPFQIGLLNHETVRNVDNGSLMWVDSAVNVRMFDGASPPTMPSMFITPFMRNINPACYPYMKATYINWQERRWYVLSVADKGYSPAPGAPRFNWMVFFDTDPEEVNNSGIFLVKFPHDVVGSVQDGLNQKYLVATQGGSLYNLELSSNTVNGLTSPESRRSTSGVLTAYYATGYFGQDNSQVSKMFRFGRLVADFDPTPSDPGFALTAVTVDDDNDTFINPGVHKIPSLRTGSSSFTIDRKSRRCAIVVDFPLTDCDCNMIELSMTYRPLSEK